jgi:hypothetical protein
MTADLLAAFSPPARTVADLVFAEHLLLWSLRQLVADQERFACVERAFVKALGRGPGRIAAGAWRGAIGTVMAEPRRPVLLHRPCCRAVSDDELALLGIVAAQQARLPRAWRRLAEALIGADAAPSLLGRLAPLAEALADDGIIVPWRALAAEGQWLQ